MAKKGVVNARNILYSKPLSFQSNTDEIENGFLVSMGDLVDYEDSIYEALEPATAALTQKMYLVDDPAWSYYTQPADIQNPENYIIPVGKAFRVRDLSANNKIDISDYSIDGAVDVGNYVTAADGSYKHFASATAPAATAGFVGVIEAINDVGYFATVGSYGKPGVSGSGTGTGLGYGVDGRYKMVTIKIIKNTNN